LGLCGEIGSDVSSRALLARIELLLVFSRSGMIFSVDSRPYPLTRIYDVFVNDFPSTWTVHGIFKGEWFFAAQALSLVRF
jgi:hypothetical protein